MRNAGSSKAGCQGVSLALHVWGPCEYYLGSGERFHPCATLSPLGWHQALPLKSLRIWVVT